jgi:hypothetical protein
MGTVLALTPATPDTNRPAEWTRYNADADAADREMIASPAYVAKEPSRCNYVALFCAGGGCGFAKSCGTCASNQARTESEPTVAQPVRHSGYLMATGTTPHHAPLSDEGGR